MLNRYCINAQILGVENSYGMVLIPWIPMIYYNNIYEFKRIQFQIKSDFSMSINRSQGQTLRIVGVDLRGIVFSHGQLYVTFSRVRSNKNLFF